MREEGRNEPLLNFHPWAGASPLPAAKLCSLSLQTVSAPGLCWLTHGFSAAMPQKQQDQMLLPQFQMALCQSLSSFWFCIANSRMQGQAMIGAANPYSNKKNINNHNNLHCEKSMCVWITSSTCNNISQLFNMKSLAAAPPCVIFCSPSSQSTLKVCFPPLNRKYRHDWDPCCMWLGNHSSPAAILLCVIHTSLILRGEAQKMGFSSVYHNFLFVEPGLSVLPLIKPVLRDTNNAVGCGDKSKGAKAAVSPCRWCPISSLHLSLMQSFGTAGCCQEKGTRGGGSGIFKACLN